MGHYISNLRDIEFNLFEVFGTDSHLGRGPFAQMDTEAAHGVLAEVKRLAEGPFADSFAEADRTPLTLSDGEVTIPEALHRSLDAYFAGEWYRLDLPEHLGGYGAPPSLRWAGFLNGKGVFVEKL
jgi:hypothetical protein